MKAFGAALIALAMLYIIDSEYNNARYTQVVANAVGRGNSALNWLVDRRLKRKPAAGSSPVGQTDGRLPVRFFVAGCFSPARNNP